MLQRLRGPEGEELVIDQYRHGQAVSHVRIQRDGERTVALGADGRVLLTTVSSSDGGLVVADATGKRVASYSSQQITDAERALQ